MNTMDIAAAAGVSPSTVSRIINGAANISPDTVAHVRKVMQELGCLPVTFKRNQFPRRQSISFQYHITALSFGWKNKPNYAYEIEFLNQLSSSLARRGLQMTYLHWPWKSQLPADLYERTHGFILMEGIPPVSLHRQLTAKPAVSLFCPPGVPGDRVLTGYYQVGRLVVNYFIQNNIRHLVLLRPLRQPGFMIEQAEGFKLCCLKEENVTFEELLPVTPKPLPGLDNLQLQVQELMNQLLSKKIASVGIFCPSCHVTALAYRYLQQLNITPGKEIHFVCSNSQPSLLWGLHPRPAIIDIGLEEMAENTANLLLFRINNPKAYRPFQISVIPSLITLE